MKQTKINNNQAQKLSHKKSKSRKILKIYNYL